MSDDVLDYSSDVGWHHLADLAYIQMSDATFQRHVEAYLAQQGIMEPTAEQRVSARLYCRRLSFWESRNDPEIRRCVFGRRSIPAKTPGDKQEE